ncbi:MAG: ribose-phosphate pyrophosphokinase-like domain-containing protein [Gammaproteobacteria bacterium]|nr:ribose-phosphate pyrophosphokinase-like domain-containing protein [Gammaproteobacteria bacterium]
MESDVKDKTILLICSLDHPNNKIFPLMFMAKILKELGAKKICLVSPYLPYMRQDKQFKSGETVTSALFAQLLSSFIDHLITIDPHLHQIKISQKFTRFQQQHYMQQNSLLLI